MTSTAMMIGLKGKSSTSNPGVSMWWATGNIVAWIVGAVAVIG